MYVRVESILTSVKEKMLSVELMAISSHCKP